MAEIFFYNDINLSSQQLTNFKIESLATAPTTPVEGRLYYNTTTKKFYGWNDVAWVDLSQVVESAVTLKGEIANANTNPDYPSTPVIGDAYFITNTSGTIGSTPVEVGDQLIYGNGGWFVLQANLQAATTTLAGYVRFATPSEANAGSSASLAISPSTLAGYLVSNGNARKTRNVIASLSANTPTTVTHGLNVANAEDLTVTCWQGGKQIGLAVSTATSNSIIVESNVTLGNVTVVCQG